ncbi:MAG: pyridoxamine 5'-phosphate oxidase family protein [Alphaproteobacteria bacterium]
MSFDDPDLAALFGLAWGRMTAAPDQRNAAFRTPVLSTVSAAGDGAPDARMVVLRRVDRPRHRLEIHTDDRAGKVADLEKDPRAALLFWDARHQFQVRAGGHAAFVTDPLAIDAVWEGLSDVQRSAYRLPFTPGAPMASKQASKSAAKPAADAGPERHFQIIAIEIDRLDCLSLDRDGHERARFTRSDEDWSGTWTAP